MEAYVLFARAKEQEEDIGCPSESSAARSTSESSDGVDLADDASSSGSTCHFEMASLMTHLPIKYVTYVRTHAPARRPAGRALLPRPFRLTKIWSWRGVRWFGDLTPRCFVWACRRGLSKFFAGKSQSFASLAAVGGIDDLPKPPAKRLKTSWSCGVGLEDARRGPPSVTTANKQASSRARLTPSALGSTPRRLVRARPLVTARPEAAAGKPLLFA
jgi:hypothetical protein